MFSNRRLALFLTLILLLFMSGCSNFGSHYRGVENSLRSGHPEEADQIVKKSEEDYGQRSRLLYLMDRGMTLHLAENYIESNRQLENAYELIEDFYTTRIRDEASAILVNEGRLPFQGAPYEQVMVHVIKALNYARLDDFEGALVEARRIDHRLNLIGDKAENDEYHEDPFARYLTGVLYEAFGDMNNAYIAYRKAEQAYQLAESWSHVPLPQQLKNDLLRITQNLSLTEELNTYRKTYPEAEEPRTNFSKMAQVVVVSLNGPGPSKIDVLLDFPISLDALQLIALTKHGFVGRSTRRTRGPDAVLYGLQGDIVRVALPRLQPKHSLVSHSTLTIENGAASYQIETQRMYDVTATAMKNLDDRYGTIVARAVARAAMKMAAAIGIGYGARAAVNKRSQAWVGFAAAAIAKIFAISTEEADIRIWRTLPGEFQIGRIWVQPGTYTLHVDSYGQLGKKLSPTTTQRISLVAGQTYFVTQRVVE